MERLPLPHHRTRQLVWWMAASAIGLAAAAVLLYSWVPGPQPSSGTDNLITAEDVASGMAKSEPVASGANFTVQRFAAQNNCTLSVEFPQQAVVGMSRSRTEVLVFFLASLTEEISSAERATVQFAEAEPQTLRVARVVTVVNVPVLYLEVPPDLERQWREAEWITLAADGKPLGRFEMGEARTKGLDALLACADSL